MQQHRWLRPPQGSHLVTLIRSLLDNNQVQNFMVTAQYPTGRQDRGADVSISAVDHCLNC